MTEEIVYADLNIPFEHHSSRPLHPSQQHNASQCPRWHQITLWAGSIGNVILVAAVIALEAGLQLPEKEDIHQLGALQLQPDKGKCVSDNVWLLRRELCNQSQSNSSVNATCKICPIKWHQYRDKCYWSSEHIKSWNDSRYDCSARNSQLLVIEDGEEMEFIEQMTQKQKTFWIGLSREEMPEKKWTWITGSQLDENRFNKPNDMNNRGCGIIKVKLASEQCKAEFQWICKRDSVSL